MAREGRAWASGSIGPGWSVRGILRARRQREPVSCTTPPVACQARGLSHRSCRARATAHDFPLAMPSIARRLSGSPRHHPHLAHLVLLLAERAADRDAVHAAIGHVSARLGSQVFVHPALHDAVEQLALGRVLAAPGHAAVEPAVRALHRASGVVALHMKGRALVEGERDVGPSTAGPASSLGPRSARTVRVRAKRTPSSLLRSPSNGACRGGALSLGHRPWPSNTW